MPEQYRRFRLRLLLPALLLAVLALSLPLQATFQTPVSRPQDPVILTGDQFPDWLGTPIDTLALYAWDGAFWRAVPFQVDELTADGNWTPFEDGLLDANDQIVLMGFDSGIPSDCAASFDLVGEAHTRSAITVSDPLNGETGTVYLYTGLPVSEQEYVMVDVDAQTVAGSYNGSHRMTFGGAADPPFVGLAGLEVNGSADIIDRLKLRINARARIQPFCSAFLPLLPIDLTEQSIGENLNPDTGITVAGAVRAVAGNSDLFGLQIYGSRFDVVATLDPVAIEDASAGTDFAICPGSLRLDNVRLSLDYRDPAVDGVVTHYRDNLTSADLLIDGIPDPGLPAAGPISWYTVRDGGTRGGLALALPALDPGTGTVQHYYVDNATGGITGDGTADTGDNLSFGDAGARIVNSARSVITLSLTGYVLPPGAPGEAGALYAAHAATPLVATADDQLCDEGVPAAVQLGGQMAARSVQNGVWVGLLLLAALTGLAARRRDW
jgi:hypothetical protein